MLNFIGGRTPHRVPNGVLGTYPPTQHVARGFTDIEGCGISSALTLN